MKQINDTKFHLIPGDYIQYMETNVYLFFYIPVTCLFYNWKYVPPNPFTHFIFPSAFFLAATSLSWRPALKSYTPVIDTALSCFAADDMVAWDMTGSLCASGRKY